MLDQVDAAAAGLDPVRLQRLSQWLDEQVSSQRVAGASVVVGRRGKIGFAEATGVMDVDTGEPFTLDTIARIYSMTKAITTVASMTLYEQGEFQLDDPVAKYLPEFAGTSVWKGGDAPLEDTVPQAEPMTVRHLMTHTSGLTYGFMQANVVDKAYRKAKIDDPTITLAEQVRRLAEIPLICPPGSQWNYSMSTDVLGRLVEVWSGQSLAEYLHGAIIGPLGMADTAFHVEAEKHARLASLYAPLSGANMSNVGAAAKSGVEASTGFKLEEAGAKSRYREPATLFSGGGGLAGTIGDYARFCQMLLNGGELDGARILSRKTVEYMRQNHLPDNADMAAMGQPVWSETSYDGIGFGLGFAVVIDPVKAQVVTSKGEHHWGGAASTFFWLDPEEDLYVVFFTQLIPSSTYPIRRELRVRVYQALE